MTTARKVFVQSRKVHISFEAVNSERNPPSITGHTSRMLTNFKDIPIETKATAHSATSACPHLNAHLSNISLF